MAKYESLRGLFTAIADAIRAKTGSTGAIVAEDFPEFIEGIEPVIEPLTITENGTYTAPDGVDGYSPVTVDVKGSGEELVITDFSYFHYSGSRLDLLGKVDTSNGIDFESMFYKCTTITTIPKLDVSKSIKFTSMFQQCKNLTTIPELDVSNSSNFVSMFSECYKLTTIPILDLVNAKYVTSMFYKCYELTNLYLYNIPVTIQIGAATSWGHKLTVDSIVHTIKELCTVTSSQTLTIGPANLEKIAGLYCRITDDTHEKKPMELCESTDEGAMTLHDYASEKNWLIQ